MFKIDITNMVPDFILGDKNGYAIAKALEAGAQMMNDIIEKGIACVLDYDTMPEWRLDELAWEMNCLYDYSADIDEKRKWIKEATPWYQGYGTPATVEKLARVAFSDGEVKEWFEYGGKPYMFKLVTHTTMDKGRDVYFYNMLKKVKNVRSCLDGIGICCSEKVNIHTGIKQVPGITITIGFEPIKEAQDGV